MALEFKLIGKRKPEHMQEIIKRYDNNKYLISAESSSSAISYRFTSAQ